jgi:hypothetical protein
VIIARQDGLGITGGGVGSPMPRHGPEFVKRPARAPEQEQLVHHIAPENREAENSGPSGAISGRSWRAQSQTVREQRTGDGKTRSQNPVSTRDVPRPQPFSGPGPPSTTDAARVRRSRMHRKLDGPVVDGGDGILGMDRSTTDASGLDAWCNRCPGDGRLEMKFQRSK